jgi:hypothetical protein
MLFAKVEFRTPETASPRINNHSLMEDHMNDVTQGSPDVTPRREFFAQAGGAVALGIAAFGATPLRAQLPSGPMT